MYKEINLGIHKVLEILIDSYKSIEIRSVLYKKFEVWNRILTVVRFSNENAEDIKIRSIDLDLKKFNLKNLKIEYELIVVSEWENFLIEIYDELNEDIEIYDPSEFRYKANEYEEYEESFLSEFRNMYNSKFARFYLTENEVKYFNIINFYYSVHDKNEHHNRFNTSLNEEVMLLGENNIYDIINRAMQLDGYSSQNGLYISMLLPIYIRVKDINYETAMLSGKIEFDKIFNGSKIFFRIFSQPDYKNETLCGTEEFLIDIDHNETKTLSQDFYEIPFRIDFKKYECDPNFEIKVFWDKFSDFYLIDFQKSFGSLKNFKESEDLREELSETIQEPVISNLKHQNLIDPSISIDIDYSKVIMDINNAYLRGFYDCAYILVRKLLENHLIDSLRLFYKMEKIEKFYNQSNGKFLTFNKLRINFNKMIHEEKFRASVGQIPQVVIDYLEIFKETGDASAHSFFSIDHQQIMEDNKGKLKILLKLLLKIYRGLQKINVEEK